MMTKFITEVSTRFNPFAPTAKTARSFLALLPPNARQNMKVNVQLLPRTSQEKTKLGLKFKDGKQMDLDVETLKIKEVTEEVNRHSRILGRQEALTSG